MDFDETRLYYTHQQLQRNPQGQNNNNNNNGDEGETADNNDDAGEGSADNVNLDAVRRHFKEFLSEWLNWLSLSRGGIAVEN